MTQLKFQRRSTVGGRVLLAVVILFTLIIISGWLTNVSEMKRVWLAPNAVPSSTSICLLLFAATVLLRNLLPMSKGSYWFSLAAGATLIGAAIATAAEGLLSADWSLSCPIGPQPEEVSGVTFPGPMAPNISAEVALLGVALLFPPFKTLLGKPISQTCALIVLLASITAIVGHALGVDFMCTMIGCIKIPVFSSALFGAACVGFLMCHPHVGVMNTLCAEDMSGQLARKLCLVLLVVPLALAMRAVAVQSGIIDQNFGWIIFAGVMIMMLWQTIGMSARNVAQIDQQKNAVEQRLQDSSAALSEVINATKHLKSGAQQKLKKVCLTCGKTFDPDSVHCPDDNDELIAVQDDSLVGAVFADRYMVTDFLGRGGMCAVYKARHIYTDKVVAIKVLLRHLASDPASLKRFQREAKSASMLSHRNLLEVFDFGVTLEGQAFIVMEFVQGKSLDDLLNEIGGRTSLPEFIEICTQICEGLQHAHENGVVHRDLKPSNVMMRDNSGKPLAQIVDFGLARMLNDNDASKITLTSQVVGSPVYLSPEQYGTHTLGPHADIYSLGCMMYEMLTGAPPFIGESLSEIVQKHISEMPPPFPPDITLPPALRETIMQMLSKDPDGRPPIEEVLLILRKHQIALA